MLRMHFVTLIANKEVVHTGSSFYSHLFAEGQNEYRFEDQILDIHQCQKSRQFKMFGYQVAMTKTDAIRWGER